MAWYKDFICPRVSKDNQLSSIETKDEQSFDDDDDYEDNGFSVGEHHAVERNVEDLNINPSKKTKQKQQKSKKIVKNSKDLEENEIIKELHEEIKAKQRKKEQSQFNSENRSCNRAERASTNIKTLYKYQMENMNYEAVNFNLNKLQNVHSQFNTHRLDNMDSPFNSPPMQLQSLFRVQFFKIVRNVSRHLP